MNLKFRKCGICISRNLTTRTAASQDEEQNPQPHLISAIWENICFSSCWQAKYCFDSQVNIVNLLWAVNPWQKLFYQNLISTKHENIYHTHFLSNIPVSWPYYELVANEPFQWEEVIFRYLLHHIDIISGKSITSLKYFVEMEDLMLPLLLTHLSNII